MVGGNFPLSSIRDPIGHSFFTWCRVNRQFTVAFFIARNGVAFVHRGNNVISSMSQRKKGLRGVRPCSPSRRFHCEKLHTALTRGSASVFWRIHQKYSSNRNKTGFRFIFLVINMEYESRRETIVTRLDLSDTCCFSSFFLNRDFILQF